MDSDLTSDLGRVAQLVRANHALDLALRQAKRKLDRFHTVFPGENTIGGSYHPLMASPFPDGERRLDDGFVDGAALDRVRTEQRSRLS